MAHQPCHRRATFVLGDIGTHLYYLSEVVLPHMQIEKLLCDRKAFIPSRAPLEDHATVLMHYDNGARGRLWVSSVNAGNMGRSAIGLWAPEPRSNGPTAAPTS